MALGPRLVVGEGAKLAGPWEPVPRLSQVESRARLGRGSGTCPGWLRSRQGPVWPEWSQGKGVGNENGEQ